MQYALATGPSGIGQHVPALQALAATVRHVTEFGVRAGVSTTAFLAAQPETLVCYDLADCPIIKTLLEVRGRCNLVFHRADTREIQIDPTDLLFIDTLHTAEQLAAELANAPRVSRYIVLHDTETFGRIGERGQPGLLVALEGFLQANPQWRQASHSRKNNGLTVLQRIAK